ncbi:TonB-dependent receptor [Gilvimarinus agarilyticus]|uniref:TonB-dependent receptor n=1 Tax=Gilvimarinus agarilyticus TaxID=679259 RepID=UPI0005A0C1DA|nr:TonB-dependent receptor [Gilvimarinus agarilyticus]
MFKRSVLSSSIALVVALGSTQVAAQDDEMLLEEVVVTGIRASLDKAQDIKRDSMQVMDAIVAEDIGKLPDNNVVESLQRVSGVQVTDRGAGEASTVTIRGLNDVSTTLNGRTIFTASGRAQALADIPSTLVNQVDVIKSRSASQYENGIAGQINVHTFRPFDFDGPRVQLNARAIYQDQSEETDPNLSGLFSSLWETGAGDFGALVNLSYASTSYRDQNVQAGAQVPYMTENPPAGSPFAPLERIRPEDPGNVVAESPIWQTGTQNGLPIAAGSTMLINGTPTEYYLARDAVIQSDFTGERERQAANVVLQFAPNDSSEYTFEALYNGYHNESFNNLLFAFVDWHGDAGDFELYEGTNVIKSRTVGNPYTFGSGDITDQSTDSFMYALTGEWDFTDRLHVKSDLAYQDSEFETEFTAQRVEGVQHQVMADFDDVAGFTFGDNPATAGVDESDMTSPQRWTMAQFFDSGARNEGSAVTFTTDADYATGWDFLHTIDFGIRYDDRDASELSRDNPQNTTCTNLVNEGRIDDISLCRPETYDGMAHINSGFMDGEADTTTSWYAPNGHYVAANKEAFMDLYQLTPQALRRTFDINEQNTALYVTGQFSVGNLEGELGFRSVNVQTDMSFYEYTQALDDEGNPKVNADGSPILNQSMSSASKDTTEFLTDLSLRYNITDELLVRASYGETLRMPNFIDLNANITYFDDVSNIGYGTASGGNPDLKPTTSQNYDLSLEYYFGEASSAYITLFRRDIENLVVSFRNRVQADIPGFNADTFTLSQPDNASEGMLEGVEVGFSYFPDNLPGALDGLGVTSSFTALDSEQTNPQTNDAGEITGYETGPMYGVSDTSYNVTAAYERESFDVRLSYVWRDNFLYGDDAASFANPLSIYHDAEESLDMQVSYDVTDGLTLTFDATNLTGELYKTSYGDSQYHSSQTYLYSTTYALGARYSF